MFGLGMPEIVIIMVIALLVFGAGKLPEVGSGLAKSIRGFRKALQEPESDGAQKDNQSLN
jgi:sec-independent protein translocase protein TatA